MCHSWLNIKKSNVSPASLCNSTSLPPCFYSCSPAAVTLSLTLHRCLTAGWCCILLFYIAVADEGGYFPQLIYNFFSELLMSNFLFFACGHPHTRVHHQYSRRLQAKQTTGSKASEKNIWVTNRYFRGDAEVGEAFFPSTLLLLLVGTFQPLFEIGGDMSIQSIHNSTQFYAMLCTCLFTCVINSPVDRVMQSVLGWSKWR